MWHNVGWDFVDWDLIVFLDDKWKESHFISYFISKEKMTFIYLQFYIYLICVFINT